IFHEFEGDQVTFVCLPGGDHTNAYSWYHGNKLLSWDIKRDLTIRNMTRSHAGNYKCLTTPGDHTAAVIKLFVHPKPKLRVLVQGNTLLWEDQSFHLSCDVLNLEGPVTYYKWYKNDIIIDVNVDYRVADYKWYKNGIIINYVKSKIYDVVGASMDDTGKYNCEIQYFNMVFKSPELQITVKARPQVRVHVQETTWLWEDQSLDLSCDVVNLEDPISYYTWYKDGIIIDGVRRTKPQIRLVVQETTPLWEDESFDLLCDVSNLDDRVTYYIWAKDDIVIMNLNDIASPYKWYKDGINID
uniref:Ig-like domain-containing protein n=1 Tax=Romanomermis culicivorax TaxID=13658 RepID=A0A915KX50_ROMCU